LATWLHRIVFNLAIDLKRRAKRRGGEALTYDDGMTPVLGVRDEEAGATPEAALRQKEQRERLMAVLDELSDEHRQAIMLREFEGMSYEEIARVSGVSVGTVMSRLFYARKRMQSVLRDVR
jgi:RNA polymerase sigma-70 factor (ECF subfamily)